MNIYIYINELDKAFLDHDTAYADSKDLDTQIIEIRF